MNISVRYVSKSGNTEKLAQAIAGALGVQAVSITAADTDQDEGEVIFLGAALYGFGIDDAVKSFIQRLDKARVKQVVVFSTTALLKSVHSQIKALLDQKGIPLYGEQLHCWGEFAVMHKGRPNEKDLERARAFAKKAAAELGVKRE
jgi:flavodoxin